MTNQAIVIPSITMPDGSSSSGCMLIERVLQEVLTRALLALKTDPGLIDDLFYKLSPTNIADIKNWISSQNIVVRTMYPEVGYTQPMVAIINTSEDEVAGADTLGDYIQEAGQDRPSGMVYQVYGITQACRYSIMCFAGKEANACIWLYNIVKSILLLNKPFLMQQGIEDPILISGRDLSFREDMLPEFGYVRAVELACNQRFSLYITEAVATSLKVTILPQTIGDVESVVTVD
jgi:hypothetical protein